MNKYTVKNQEGEFFEVVAGAVDVTHQTATFWADTEDYEIIAVITNIASLVRHPEA